MLLLLLCGGICYSGLLISLVWGPRLVSAWPWQKIRRVLQWVLVLYPLGVVGIVGVQQVLQRTEGWLALAGIFAPYLLLSTLALIPFTLLRSWWLLRLSVAVCLGWWLIGYTLWPRTTTPQIAEDSMIIRVLNWNTLVDNWQAERVLPVLYSEPADIIVLQETYGSLIEQDAQITAAYPYRLVRTAAPDVVILSKYPLRLTQELGPLEELSGMQDRVPVRVELSPQHSLLLIAVHAPTPKIYRGCRIVCYSTVHRDQQLGVLQTMIKTAQASGEPVLVSGDLNISTYEPMYAHLTSTMHEAFDVARIRSDRGVSWPLPTRASPILRMLWPVLPLIKIDHMLVDHTITVLEAQIDCTPHGSDHCMLLNTLAIPAR